MTASFSSVYKNVYDIENKKQNEVSVQDSIGGAAIASGGFGCVFRPAIKCKGDAKPRDGMISKLMNHRNAHDELMEVENAEKHLKIFQIMRNISQLQITTDVCQKSYRVKMKSHLMKSVINR